MYPEFLPDHYRPYYSTEYIFSSPGWVRIFEFHNFSTGMHSQGFYEINVIFNGIGRHYIENTWLDVKKGDVFIIPPHIRHGYASSEGFDVYHASFHPDFWHKYAADFQKLPSFFLLFNIEPLMRKSESIPLYLSIDEEKLAELGRRINELRIWCTHEDSAGTIMCNSTAVMLIAQLCSMYAQQHKFDKYIDEKEDSWTFMESISLIYEKYYDKITIDKLSKIAKMSRTVYFNKFKRIMGDTPAKFILLHRIGIAKQMLLNTNLKVSDIAEKTGFYDAPYFISCFIKTEGCTPLEYRNNK